MKVPVYRYLVVGQQKQYGPVSVRLTKKAPSLAPHEVALKLFIDLPEALFRKPALSVTVSVPDGTVSDKPAVPATVVHDITEVLQRELGIDVTVSAVLGTEIK